MRRLVLIAIVLVFATAIFWFSDHRVEVQADQPGSSEVTKPKTPDLADEQSSSKPTPSTLQHSAQRPSDRSAAVPEAVDPDDKWQVALDSTESLAQYRNRMSLELFPTGVSTVLATENTDGSAELAYLKYVALDYCADAALDPSAMDARMAYHDRLIADTPELAEVLQDMMESGLRRFDRCSDLGPYANVSYEAFVALNRAVDLRHEPATLEYYDAALRLLYSHRTTHLAPLAQRYPGVVEDFRQRGQRVYQYLVSSPHAEALPVLARIHAHGILIEADIIEASAYAIAAEFTGILPQHDRLDSEILRYLDANQSAEARTRGEKIYTAWKLTR